MENSHDQTASPGKQRLQRLRNARRSRSLVVDRTPAEALPDRVDPVPFKSLAQSAAASRPSDLLTLPGAGPGVVWMLGQVGIRSLADLAQADLTLVKARLGVLGELLELTIWQDEALRVSSTNTPAKDIDAA